MAYSLIKAIRITTLISSVVICVSLILEAHRENLAMEWQRYQRQYREELKRLASSESEIRLAEEYQIKLRQVFLPSLNRADRCMTCHVAMEDPRMAKSAHPLRSHPGNYLELHEVERFGCTICHDGQGRAITFAESKARGDRFYWEKPLLPAQFTQSNCLRCHDVDDLKEDSLVRKGQQIFVTNGCLGCHRLKGKGQNLGPDQSDLGNVSFHKKYPVSAARDLYLAKFSFNKNIAYIYESIINPKANAADSLMRDFDFSEEELLALTAFLKGMTLQDIPFSFRIPTFLKRQFEAREFSGKDLFAMYCNACHGKEAAGGVPNRNTEGGEIPALIRVKAGYTKTEVVKVIIEGKIAKLKNPQGPSPLNMPPWNNVISKDETEKLISYLFSLMPEEIDDW